MQAIMNARLERRVEHRELSCRKCLELNFNRKNPVAGDASRSGARRNGSD